MKRVRLTGKPVKRVRAVDGLDLCARKVLMASFLYYSLDVSAVPDGTYDEWCRRLSDNWDDLDRYRQWQLGSPEELLTSGYHVKITYATIGGALSWMTMLGTPINRAINYSTEPSRSKRHKVDWWPATAFAFGVGPSTKQKRPKVGRQRPDKRDKPPKRARLRLRG